MGGGMSGSTSPPSGGMGGGGQMGSEPMPSGGMGGTTKGPSASAAFVPLGQLARIETVMGPPMIKSEMGSITGLRPLAA